MNSSMEATSFPIDRDRSRSKLEKSKDEIFRIDMIGLVCFLLGGGMFASGSFFDAWIGIGCPPTWQSGSGKRCVQYVAPSSVLYCTQFYVREKSKWRAQAYSTVLYVLLLSLLLREYSACLHVLALLGRRGM